MTATKTELLERTRVLWEAALSEVRAGGLTDGETEGSSRVDVYEFAEKARHADDDLGELASWAFNQAVHVLARAEGASKDMRVLIRNVTLELFDEMMRSNLEHVSWEKEKLIRRNMPALLHDLN